MKELVETMVKELVDEPGAVEIAEKPGAADDGSDLIEIKVAKEDMGRIIGKEGRIAKSLRTIVRSAGIKQGKNYRVDIIE